MIVQEYSKNRIYNHVKGIDTIRLICTIIVAVDHFMPTFDFRFIGISADLSHKLSVMITLPFNGQAAVVVFFILSGFVIHLPFLNDKTIGTAEFYMRRWIRVAVPSLVFVALFLVFIGPAPAGDWNNTVLWSVVCELIYYTLYPAMLRSGLSMTLWLALSLLASSTTIALNVETLATHSNFTAFGIWQTWIVGFPLWIAGCLVAERFRSLALLPLLAIWAMRLAILAIAGLLVIVRYHLPLPPVLTAYPFTLSLFGALAATWLAYEARWLVEQPKAPWLDRIGVATFSTYLVHWFAVVAIPFELRSPKWLVVYFAAVALATAAFYQLIEQPSHKLARRAGARMRS